jgi:hypothetical protein
LLSRPIGKYLEQTFLYYHLRGKFLKEALPANFEAAAISLCRKAEA